MGVAKKVRLLSFLTWHEKTSFKENWFDNEATLLKQATNCLLEEKNNVHLVHRTYAVVRHSVKGHLSISLV